MKVWAVSGEQRGSFGGKKEFIRPKWAILGVTHLTPPMRKFAQVTPAYQHAHIAVCFLLRVNKLSKKRHINRRVNHFPQAPLYWGMDKATIDA